MFVIAFVIYAIKSIPSQQRQAFIAAEALAGVGFGVEIVKIHLSTFRFLF
jgi:hypothetical protein